MNNRYIFPSIALFFITIMAGYFFLNSSYEKSLKAKYYYEIGEYKEAQTLAKEAFSINLYNRMASTMMVQSDISLKYVAYIESAKKYMKTINEMATHEYLDSKDRAKMRIICEIMMESHKKLAPSVITNVELVTTSASYHQKFVELYEKIDK